MEFSSGFKGLIEILFLVAFARSRKAPYYLHGVRLAACVSAAATSWFSLKFDIGDFHDNLAINSKFG